MGRRFGRLSELNQRKRHQKEQRTALRKLGVGHKPRSTLPTPEDRKRRNDRHYNGQNYASMLEVRMARLLDSRGIPFEYGQKFATTNREGKPNTREVDFLILGEPIKVYFSSRPIQAIEVKGYFGPRAWFQRKELKGVGVNTLVVTEPLLAFWEKFAFLRSESLPPYSPSDDVYDKDEQRGDLLFKGTQYKNELDLMVAKILDSNGIKAKYKQKVLVHRKDGSVGHRIVDFWIVGNPIKVYWCPYPLKAILVKELLDDQAWHQRRELKESFKLSKNTSAKHPPFTPFIAVRDIIVFWSEEAFLRTQILKNKSRRRGYR